MTWTVCRNASVTCIWISIGVCTAWRRAAWKYSRRQGLEPVAYAHPLLEPALAETLGVVVFQEQVLRVHPVALDVTHADGVAAAFDNLEAALGPATIVVNNAGIPSSSRFADMPEDEWRGVLDVNLDGVFRVGQEAARRMKAAAQGGSIINISSVAGHIILRGFADYNAAKAALIAYSKTMSNGIPFGRFIGNIMATIR